MERGRRAYLGGVLTIEGASEAPEGWHSEIPVLHGDKVHDDSDALDALFLGRPFIVEGEMEQARPGDVVKIENGSFLISRKFVRPDPRIAVHLYGSTFDSSGVSAEEVLSDICAGTISVPLRE